MAVVLGIDGGGTNTRAAVAVDGKLVAQARGGSIKRLRVGAETADANLRAILRDVLRRARVDRVDAACCGMASSSMPGIREWVMAVLDEFAVARSEVVGDDVIALDAAFHGGPGILQIAGTGSNTVGRAPDGSYECAGGWSSRLGDEGSGYWIGVNALRRALHAYDREAPQKVLQRVSEVWGTPGIDALINFGDATPGPDFAALAPVINQLAEEGDAVSLGVLRQAAADLIEFVLLVRDKLRRKHDISGEVPVAWTGSVIARMPIVREAFFSGLKAKAPGMPVLPDEIVSVEGAIWRAQQLLRT